jgi:NCS1 family nucleobase:cation symporter-1
MITSVPLTLPGLVNSINPNIHVGVGTRLFDIAYMLGVSATFIFRRHEMALNLTRKFTLASTIYFTLSKLFPANDTILDHAIIGDGDVTLSDNMSFSNGDSKKDDTQVDESKVA